MAVVLDTTLFDDVYQWLETGRWFSPDGPVSSTNTCAISANHHWRCEFESHSWQGVLNTTLCDKVCQWLAIGRWFSTGTPASFTNKTDLHDIAEILLKVALNTIILILIIVI